MAKVIETDDGTMLTVDLGVGPGRANNRDDVTVVQYLLNLYFQHPNQARVRDWPLGQPQARGRRHHRSADQSGDRDLSGRHHRHGQCADRL